MTAQRGREGWHGVMEGGGGASGLVAEGAGRPGWETFSRVLLDASPHGVVASAARGVVVFANRVAEAGLGIRAGGMLYEMLPELWVATARTIEEVANQLGISVQGRERAYIAKVSAILSDSGSVGELCIFEVVTEPEAITRG